MASIRQAYQENLAGKYAVTATISGVSGKLTFEIEDRPGYYRQLLEKMKKQGFVSPVTLGLSLLLQYQYGSKS